MKNRAMVRAEYTPLRRAVALLHVLTRTHRDSPDRAFTDTELMRMVSGYGSGTNAVRTLANDKTALRARGLIETNVPMPDQRSQRGTRRAALLDKAPQWHLSTREHEALRNIRRALRREYLSVGPTEPPVKPTRSCRVDEALRLIRLLEEHGGPVEVEVAARSLGVGVRQAARWLGEVDAGFDDSSLFSLVYRRDDDDINYSDLVSAELVRRNEPLTATGTALLGLFPYSADEVAERLELIDDYRRSVEVGGDIAEHLDSIDGKLRAWAHFLANA